MTVEATPLVREPAVAGLKGKLFSGMALSAVAGFLNRFILFLATALLARLLGPHVMGIGNMAGLILTAIVLTVNRGVPQSVVRMRDRDMALLADTGFYLMLALGLIVSVAFALSAPLFAAAFAEPQLTRILPVLSLGVFAFAFGRIHSAVMDRELSTWRRFVPQVVASIGFLVVSAPMALLHFGVWSIVGGHLAFWTSYSVFNILMTSWRPGRRFSWPVAKEMLRFTRDMTITGLSSYGFRNIDNASVGRFLGASALGIYSMAFNLASAPLLLARPVGDRGLFPVFAAAQQDRAELMRLYRLTVRLFSTLGMISGVLLVALTPDLVRLVYGDAWLDAVLPVQILALQGALGTAVLPNIPILTALNKRRQLYPIIFSTFFLLVILLYPATQYGATMVLALAPVLGLAVSPDRSTYYALIAVSVAACFAWLVGEIASVLLVARVLDFSPLQPLKVLAKPLAGSILAVAPTIVVPDLLFGSTQLNAVGLLRLAVESGAALGLLALWLFKTDPGVLQAYRQLKGLRRRVRQAASDERDEGALAADSFGPGV